MTVKKCRYLVVFFLLGLIFQNHLFVTAAVSAQELVVFSSRKEPLIKPVVDLFEQRTGIKVVMKTGKSPALIQQILQELPDPSTDVYIAKESGSLEYLRLTGALARNSSAAVEAIPAQFRSHDGAWVGVSGRSRAVIYNKDLISHDDVPKSLFDLMDPKYRGKIAAVNSGNESFIAWISALRITLSDYTVRELLAQLKKNNIVLISKSHTDVRKAVGRGEYPLGLINHYYYHLQRHENEEALRNVGIVYLDQGKQQRGEIVNVSGVGIVKGAQNFKEARKFVDFLASEEAQTLFAELNYEYPLLPGVTTHPEVLEVLNCSKDSAIECLKIMDVDLDQLGVAQQGTIEMLDEFEWN